MALRIPSSSEVGERIRAVRELAGLTGRQLAGRMGSSDSALLSQLEHGQKKIIDLAKLMRVAEGCAGEGKLEGISPEEVMDYLLFRVDWEIQIHPKKAPRGPEGDGAASPDDLEDGSSRGQLRKKPFDQGFPPSIEPSFDQDERAA